MSQLGERLRNARESQGIGLSQAAIETRILQRYLVALEEGDYQHLPGDVYARGFIRNYAMYLGIPADELIEQYRRDRGISEPIRVVPATSSPRIRGLVIPSFFGVFFVVLMLVGISYLLLSATNQVGESSRTQVAVQPTAVATPPPLPTPLPASTSAPVVAVVATAAPTLGPAGLAASPAPGATAASDAPIDLVVTVDAGDNPGSWLEIKTDSQTVFKKVLGPGLTVRYPAKRDIWIRAGNAAVVSVTINGTQMPRMSTTPGDVQTFTWPPR
jgi:cytoskeleton protein RodZ